MDLWRWVLLVTLVAGGWGGVERLEAQRLPGGVRPEHYGLRITPDLKARTFAGTETIDLVLDRATDTITLNAAEIEFSEVLGAAIPNANPEAPSVWQTATVTPDAAKEQVAFKFPHFLPVGPVTLKIAYTGMLNDRLRGFYLSRTKTRSYGVTQFEATDARRAFPSFDEPALKATFDVALVVDSGDTSISNTKIVSDQPGPGPGKHTLKFATTPKMSTYLVAWLVGDFRCSEGKADGVAIRACATPDKVGLTRFALQTAEWTLKYYDRYFGIKYPLKKLDMVSVPDFEAAAMENFGCLTFRDSELLVDWKTGAIPAKKAVARTVAHEMAHQWFGDMVTMAWWDNLWLNEGFATWMETKAAAKWHPEWQYAEDVALEKDETLDLDSQATTRPIRARAETPPEIDAMFDGIAYGKAGAVIGMVEHWVGDETFRRGVQAYLAAHLYGSATAEDFWDAQTRVSALPVDRVMRSFVEQPGVPLIELGERQGTAVAASERRFFVTPAAKGASVKTDGAGTKCGLDCGLVSPGDTQTWTVPICVRSHGCEVVSSEKRLLTAPKHVILYANAEDKGYYRTTYAAAEFAEILAHAETGLSSAERIGLVGDRWALMRAGQETVGKFLDLALAMKRDESATVMESTLGKIALLGERIASDADRVRLDAVVRAEFGPVYANLGTADKHDQSDKAELRGSLFEALGRAKDPRVMAEAENVTKELFAGHKLGRDSGETAIADAAVALAVTKGDTEMYNKLLSVSQSATDPDLKEDALRTLTRFENPSLVARTLEYALSDEVRRQDSWTLLGLLLARRETQDQAWEYVEENWTAVSRKATVNSGVRIVEAAGAFCTVERRDEVARFFALHPVEAGEGTLRKSLGRIDDCIHLRATQEPELRKWLDARETR